MWHYFLINCCCKMLPICFFFKKETKQNDLHSPNDHKTKHWWSEGHKMSAPSALGLSVWVQLQVNRLYKIRTSTISFNINDKIILLSALVITKILATFGQGLCLTEFDFNMSVNVGIFSEEYLQYECDYLQKGKVKDMRFGNQTKSK